MLKKGSAILKAICRLTILFISAVLFSMCIEPRASDSGPVKIILDTDMGSDCDDAGALAQLHRYADLGMAEIIGCIYSSGKVPYGAGIIEAINIYYGRPDIPIGAYYGDEVGDPVDKMSAGKLVRDTVAFGNTIIYNTDTEEQTRLNRRLLAGEEDGSIVYVTIGHTKGLYELLVSGPDDISPLNGHELVARKVKKWIAMGGRGAINENNAFSKDWNLFRNNTAPYSKYLSENFPAPVYYSDGGTNIMTGKSLKYTEPGNIVRTVYRDWLWNNGRKTLDDQRPSWDLVAVYLAVEGKGKYLENRGRGLLEVNVEEGSRWHPVDDGYPEQYFIQLREGVNEDFASYLNEMIAAEPANIRASGSTLVNWAVTIRPLTMSSWPGSLTPLTFSGRTASVSAFGNSGEVSVY